MELRRIVFWALTCHLFGQAICIKLSAEESALFKSNQNYLSEQQARALNPETGEYEYTHGLETDENVDIQVNGHNGIIIGCHGSKKNPTTYYSDGRNGNGAYVIVVDLDAPIDMQQNDGKVIQIVIHDVLPQCRARLFQETLVPKESIIKNITVPPPPNHHQIQILSTTTAYTDGDWSTTHRKTPVFVEHSRRTTPNEQTTPSTVFPYTDHTWKTSPSTEFPYTEHNQKTTPSTTSPYTDLSRKITQSTHRTSSPPTNSFRSSTLIPKPRTSIPAPPAVTDSFTKPPSREVTPHHGSTSTHPPSPGTTTAYATRSTHHIPLIPHIPTTVSERPHSSTPPPTAVTRSSMSTPPPINHYSSSTPTLKTRTFTSSPLAVTDSFTRSPSREVTTTPHPGSTSSHRPSPRTTTAFTIRLTSTTPHIPPVQHIPPTVTERHQSSTPPPPAVIRSHTSTPLFSTTTPSPIKPLTRSSTTHNPSPKNTGASFTTRSTSTTPAIPYARTTPSLRYPPPEVPTECVPDVVLFTNKIVEDKYQDPFPISFDQCTCTCPNAKRVPTVILQGINRG